MDWKELRASVEVWTGAGLILVGFAFRALGAGDLLAAALPAFGMGLMLSAAAVNLAQAAREKAKVRTEQRREEPEDKNLKDRERH